MIRWQAIAISFVALIFFSACQSAPKQLDSDPIEDQQTLLLPPWQRYILAADGDDDGRVSLAEHRKLGARRFSECDKDANERVSEHEYIVALSTLKPMFFSAISREEDDWVSSFESIDQDGNKCLNQKEWQAHVAHVFKSANINKDRFLTDEELHAYRRQSLRSQLNSRFLAADIDGDERIVFKEFIGLYPKLDPQPHQLTARGKKVKNSKQLMRDFFAFADTNGDLALEYEELFVALDLLRHRGVRFRSPR